MTRHRIDFLRTASGPRIGWVLLALGLLALAVALGLKRHWSSERTARAVAAQAAQAAQSAQQAMAAPAKPPEPSLAAKRWVQARVELQQPWLRVMRVVEARTRSPIFLLSMRFEPANGVVKLEAEAPTFADAVSYVDSLREGGDLLPALLTSHDTVLAGAPETAVIRFTAVTRWVAP